MNLPAVPDSFYWTHESWGAALRCRPLDAVAQHLFTTRQLELRGGGERSGGWQAIAAALDVGESALVCLRQVHGRDVVVIRDGEPRPSFDAQPDADVLVSNDEHSAIAVQAADCVPLLLADPTTGVVAAVHAGWRGTVAGAARAAVDSMQQAFGARPADLIVAIGPSIGVCCYEVGSELVEAFADAGHEPSQIERWFSTMPSAGRQTLRLDLWAANRDQLLLAGVREDNVHVCGLCTASNPDVLYSYRAEGAAAGRLAAAIRPCGARHPRWPDVMP